MLEKINILFTGLEVRIGKNCALGLEYGPRPTQDKVISSGHLEDFKEKNTTFV